MRFHYTIHSNLSVSIHFTISDTIFRTMEEIKMEQTNQRKLMLQIKKKASM